MKVWGSGGKNTGKGREGEVGESEEEVKGPRGRGDVMDVMEYRRAVTSV